MLARVGRPEREKLLEGFSVAAHCFRPAAHHLLKPGGIVVVKPDPVSKRALRRWNDAHEVLRDRSHRGALRSYGGVKRGRERRGG